MTMHDRLRHLYLTGRLTDGLLDSAVSRDWVSQAEADQIRADAAA